jgi:Transposase DDE domain
MVNKINLLLLFCYVDDFCLGFEPEWNKKLIGKVKFCETMTMAEVLTILIWFQTSGWRCFKNFYQYLQQHHKQDFPNLLSYNRFIEIKPRATIPLSCLLQFSLGACTGTSFIDATPLKVCHNKRIFGNKVFKDLAKRGKSTMGWFFGFKLHITCNTNGELLSVKITTGNCDDRKSVKDLCKNIFGKVYGDKGYVSHKLFEEMLEVGVQIVTQLREKMKPKIMPLEDRLMLKKRSLIESVFHILKDVLHIDHSRHRSPKNFLINFMGALTAYCLYPNKPSIRLEKHEMPKFSLIENIDLAA